MTLPIFITGNQHKLMLLKKLLAIDLEHQSVDLLEIQSLDAREVVTHKAKQAYELIQKPVLVEDVSVVFKGMGALPGPFIKWFLESVGTDGLCHLAQNLSTQEAIASVTYALYDGNEMRFFEAHRNGSISSEPRGSESFGWNYIFIPEGSTKTYAEMDDDLAYSLRYPALTELHEYLTNN